MTPGDQIPGYMSLASWEEMISSRDQWLLNRLEEIYGPGYERLDTKLQEYLSVVKGFKKAFPSEVGCIFVRAPGRINLMGRHVDHRGGDVNMIAIDSEVYMAASPRDDDKVIAVNADHGSHPPATFSIRQLLADPGEGDWDDFINCERTVRMVRESQGDWSNYLKAAALRLQFEVHDKPLKGMQAYVMGTIPQAAGLSSSSALVVCTLEALAGLNRLTLKPREFIDLCGTGEWFVGTRGGSSDHAAIKVSNRDCVTRIGFFDFQIKDQAPFPEGYELMVINSMRHARKARETMVEFNKRILGYEVGFLLIKEKFPELNGELKYFRDLCHVVTNHGKELLRDILLALPIEVKFSDLERLLPGDEVARLRARFQYMDEETIPVRGVVLFGISECMRSATFFKLLKAGEVERIGQLMFISHDGDRVGSLKDFSDAALESILESEVSLEDIPGDYGCSIDEIDFIVDFLRGQDGVVGAQISGAGLGGCAMALVKKGYAGKISRMLEDAYEKKFGIKPECLVTRPIAGASIIR